MLKLRTGGNFRKAKNKTKHIPKNQLTYGNNFDADNLVASQSDSQIQNTRK